MQGILTLEQICKKHSKRNGKLNISRLTYQMKLRGVHARRVAIRKKAKKPPPLPPSQSPAIAKKANAIADGLQVIARRHINGFKELQNMAAILAENMRRSLESVGSDGVAGANVIAPAFLGTRETVTDYMKKLTDVYSKSVEMERRCLGLDKDMPDEKVQSYEDRLKKLHESVLTLPDNTADNVIEGEFKEVAH